MDIMIKHIGKKSRNKFMTAFFDSLEKVDAEAYTKVKSLPGFALIVTENEEKIKAWEKYLELKSYSNWTLADRIERILYTLNSSNTFTLEFLKEQCKFFTNGEIEVDEQFSEYHFVIQFTSMIGVPPNIDNVKEMINLNKPAHLTFEIKFRFRTHNELRAFRHVDLRKYTHAELRARGVITRNGNSN